MSRDIHRRSFRTEHGPRDFYYSTLPDGQPHPVIQCLCAWFPETICDTWAEAGAMFDVHIHASLRQDTAQFIEATVAAMPKATAPARKRRTAKGRG